MPDKCDGLPKQRGVFVRRGDAIDVDTRHFPIEKIRFRFDSLSHFGAWVTVELSGGSEPWFDPIKGGWRLTKRAGSG